MDIHIFYIGYVVFFKQKSFANTQLLKGDLTLMVGGWLCLHFFSDDCFSLK